DPVANAPILRHLPGWFLSVFTNLFRDGVSPHYSANFGAIGDQYHRHFVDLSADLHAHAWIAHDVGPPRLGIRELFLKSESLLRSAYVEFVAAHGKPDRY